MNLPPVLLQPPPRDPAWSKGIVVSRLGVGLRLLGGVWMFMVLLVGLLGLRAYLKYGDFDVVIGFAVAGLVGAALSLAVVLGLVIAHQRMMSLFRDGVMTTGRVRSAQPNVRPEYPARIEIEFPDAWSRPSVGFILVAWTSASWLTPGILVPVFHVPADGRSFGAFVDGVGLVSGARVS